jgi:hypothetical protein
LKDFVIRSGKIAWAAAVILFGSGIALALGIFAFFVPGADRTVSIIAVVIGAFGIVTGIGLFARWRWARISALILSGLSAYVGFTVTPLIPFIQIPVPSDLGEQITKEAATETAMRIKILFLIVFLLVGAVGFWWAYLFENSATKELFGSSVAIRPRPFMFSVIGWYFVINAILGVFTLWDGVRHSPALMMDFGSLLVGWNALIVRASYTAVQLFLGSGLLRGKKQSRRFAIYFLLFVCLDVIVFFLRPGREARIAAYHGVLVASRPTFDMYFTTTFWSHYMKATSIEWSIFAVVTIWFLTRLNSTSDPAKS